MEVVKLKTEDGKERYFVANDDGLPIEPILKFIRFKDNTNFARNTLRMYCQHLKLYFEYLQQRELDFQKVTIDDLALFVNWLHEQKINFNSVSQLSGVSKTFLYNNQEIKKRIEELRDKQVSRTINQRAKYDKTSKSKDIIIMAKDKKIKELEEENRKLKEQLEVLRGKLYEKL
ncbi:MAG: hypothetical protein NSGCLCUN01_02703 [uncultured Clostridium sp.]